MARSSTSRTGSQRFIGPVLLAVALLSGCATQADTSSRGRDLSIAESSTTSITSQKSSTTSVVVQDDASEPEVSTSTKPTPVKEASNSQEDDPLGAAPEVDEQADDAEPDEPTSSEDEDSVATAPADDSQIAASAGPADPSTGVRSLSFEDTAESNGARVTVLGLEFRGSETIVSLTGVNIDRELISLNVPRGEMYLIDDLGNRYEINDPGDDSFVGIARGETIERNLGFTGTVASDAASVTLRINDVAEQGEFLTATIHPEFSFGPYPLLRE